MITDTQSEPSMHHSELFTKHYHNVAKSDVNLSTQLSIADHRYDSPIPTSTTQHLFTCQPNNNSIGNLSFPLAQKDVNTMKYIEKISWHDLLKQLKSQKIVKNLDIFHKFKRNQPYDINTQQFPLEIDQRLEKDNFPCQSNDIKRKGIKSFAKLKFPLKVNTGSSPFPLSPSDSKKHRTIFKIKKFDLLTKKDLSSKSSKKNLKKLSHNKQFKNFPCSKTQDFRNKNKFPLLEDFTNISNDNKTILKFPEKFPQNQDKFPYEFQNKPKIKHNFEQLEFIKLQNPRFSYKNAVNNSITKTKFPCELNLKKSKLFEFPLNNENVETIEKQTQQRNLLNNNLPNNNNWNKVNNSNNLKTTLSSSSCLPSLSMTQNGQNIDNEHVSQVQDAQVYRDENPPPPTPPAKTLKMSENNLTPPQTTLAKTTNNNNNNVDDDSDVYILAAINSINNTRPNEVVVGQYVEKIERLEDAIVALFETIQQDLQTNHNREYESANASKHGHDQHNDGDDHHRQHDESFARFALTPPMSVTSVRKIESNENNEKVPQNIPNICDLVDLCDREVGGQIVECSDVRDTLAEAVDYGVTKKETNSTGSFLVKSEEQPTSPNSPIPQTLNESNTYTSHIDSTNASENLLPKYNVLGVNIESKKFDDKNNNLEFDPNKANDINEKISSEIIIPILDTCKINNNSLISENVSEMTITRLADSNEQENSSENNHLQTNEALEHKSDILCNDLEIDEMKYEMNRVKGALPSSVSERAALSKNDHVGIGNSHYSRHNPTNTSRLTPDSSLSNTRLPTSLSSTRNYNDSSYTPRSSVKNDSSSSSKRSSLTSHLPQDGITHRSTLSTPHSLHENTSTRSGLTPAKYSNDISTETTANRRPSLGSLKQSPSLQSVDLPRYNPTSSTSRTEPTSSNNRSISSESSLGDALPERTRLRRQRRLRSQDSQDEQEDPIERLNRLKARISASLSEVKGVLKQYSTEGENEQENQGTAINAIVSKETKQEEKKPEAPVTFRFVKKVRRRSLFSEEEEENEKKKDEAIAKEKTENHEEKNETGKDETDNIKTEIKSKLPVENSEIKKEQIEQILEKPREEKIDKVEKIETNDVKKQPPTEPKEVKINKDLYTLKEEAQESLENNINGEANLEEKIPPQEIKEEKHNEDNKKVKEEPKIVKEENEVNEAKAETQKMETEPVAAEHSTKIKKRIVIKPKDPARRASLAAVEGSKIEPPVKVAIPAKIHRRPSDSEAVVKKKLITAKIKTSGAVEEVTPKPKIVKVKKSIIKTNKNSQLATTQEKSKDEEEKGENTAATVITTNDKKCDNHVKSINEDNKSIHIDKNKEVLMPKQLEQQQQQPKQQEQQQQINNINTSQTNLLLPTQLVIDEAASLNLKTIENSVLQPKQQQQLQEQNQQSQQRQDDKQATINSTTTNIKSNDLQVGGAMLENLTTVLSSSKTSEANGQIERENIIVQSDNLSDLLQHEATIIKPSTTVTNKTNEQNNTKPQGNQQTKLKDLLLKQASTEKFQENLENQQAKSIKEQKQDQQQKQVVATTDVVVVKSEDDNENIKVNKDSLKEPCIDKTPTSTHIVAEHHKQQQQQQQQDQHHNQLLIEGEQSITHATTTADTKTISSPHISISSNSDLTPQTTQTLLPNATVDEHKTTAVTANEQNNKMPELQLAPAPVQTAEIIPHPEQHKKKTILKKIVRQSSIDKTKKSDTEKSPTTQDAKPETAEEKQEQETATLTTPESPKDELSEERSESTEVSETSTSQGSEELPPKPKKERKVKKKVIIKRQKRRLSIGDNFFHPGVEEEPQNTEIETLEKPIAYVSDDDDESDDNKNEQPEEAKEEEEPKKPLKSCIMHKEYHIGDIVLYAERYRKTQVRWRRGRIKERITSISYLLDIDGKDVSSHINYLKKWTGRKVSFGTKEYLEIDYEQLAEEEEKAERLKRRTYSIWNMV